MKKKKKEENVFPFNFWRSPSFWTAYKDLNMIMSNSEHGNNPSTLGFKIPWP